MLIFCAGYDLDGAKSCLHDAERFQERCIAALPVSAEVVLNIHDGCLEGRINGYSTDTIGFVLSAQQDYQLV